jgi:phosphohistidine swiveling domain-containing protein
MFYGHLNQGLQRGAELLSAPTSRSFWWKIYNGYGYLTRAMPREDEIPKREELFKTRFAKVLEDPFGLVDKYCAEARKVADPLKPIKVEELDLGELLKHFYDCIHMDILMVWQYFQGWLTNCYGLGFAQSKIAEYGGIQPHDPEYSILIRGVDSDLYRANAGIAKLATRAMELKLEDAFKLPDSEVLKALEENEAGRQFRKEFFEFLDTYGWRAGRMYEIVEPGWIEEPAQVIREIKRYMAVGGVHRADEERPKMIKEREEVEKKILDKTPLSERELVRKLINYCRAATYHSEHSGFHIEMHRHALMRRCIKECGRRLAQYNVIREPDDVFFLFWDEIASALIPLERGRFYRIVEERKAEWEHYKSLGDKMPWFLVGGPDEAREMLRLAPEMSVHAGVPIAKPEEVGALLVGAAGAPGVAEGVARVIMFDYEMDKIQPGDILVTPMTSATWTQVFGIIKAVVTDTGGALSHPAIVAREYGIPAVVGTMDATKKIKTGDRIRVDGNLLRVYKID